MEERFTGCEKCALKKVCDNVRENIKKIANLYHSNSDQYKKKDMLIASAVFAILTIALGLIFNATFENDVIFKIGISKIITKYFLGVGAGMSIYSFTGVFYIFGKPEKKKRCLCVAYIIYSAILFLGFLPTLIAGKVIEALIEKRAKKSDNIIAVLVLLIVDMMLAVIEIQLDRTFHFTERLYSFVSNYSSLRLIPCELFIALGIPCLVILLVNFIALGINKKIRIWKIKKEINNGGSLELKQTEMDNSEKSDKEIEHIQNNDKYDEVDYDIEYRKSTLNIALIMAMILIFFIATFSNSEDIVEISTDLVNVVTCFSLIILFIDKCREARYVKKLEE